MPLKRSAAMARGRERPEVSKRDSSGSESERVTEATQELSKRARLCRTATMEKLRRQETDWQQKHTLFDNVLLVTINDAIEPDTNTRIRKPIITYSYKDEDNSCHIPAELIFPDYSHSLLDLNGAEPMANISVDEEYVISLTDGLGHRKNAYCVKFVPNDDNEGPSSNPAVFAIVSPMKSTNFYLELARTAVDYYRSSPAAMKAFLKSIYRHKYPTMRGSCLVVLERDANGNERKLTIRNTQSHLQGYPGACKIVKSITPEFMTCIVAALLSEQRVLIAGNSIRITTQAVQSIEAILRPLVWPHTFVPIIPDNLVDLCHNPTPFLMGILRKNLSLIHDLIATKNVVEEDTFKENFVLFDVDGGMIVPQPMAFSESLKQSEWRTLSALAFCESKAMPKRVALNLIANLTQACNKNSDIAVQEAMLQWYSKLFGHYRHLGCHLQWDDEAKSRLIKYHKSQTCSKYLGFLAETILFEEWIKQRVNFSAAETEKSVENLEEESQSRQLAKIWEERQSNTHMISDRKGIGKIVTKVGNVFQFMRASVRK